MENEGVKVPYSIRIIIFIPKNLLFLKGFGSSGISVRSNIKEDGLFGLFFELELRIEKMKFTNWSDLILSWLLEHIIYIKLLIIITIISLKKFILFNIFKHS